MDSSSRLTHRGSDTGPVVDEESIARARARAGAGHEKLAQNLRFFPPEISGQFNDRKKGSGSTRLGVVDINPSPETMRSNGVHPGARGILYIADVSEDFPEVGEILNYRGADYAVGESSLNQTHERVFPLTLV